MRYTILKDGVAIGHSDLERLDALTGSAQGVFRPAAAYASVAPVMRAPLDDESDDLDAYYDPRDLMRLLEAPAFRRVREMLQLGLVLHDAAGRLVPTRFVLIIDDPDALGPPAADDPSLGPIAVVALAPGADWQPVEVGGASAGGAGSAPVDA